MKSAVAIVAIAVLLGGALPVPAAQTHAVAPSLWDRPRTAAAILNDTVVRGVVLSRLAQPGARLVIHHAPVTDAQLQAEELRAWLAALAVDPERTILTGSLKPGEPLKLEIVP